MKRLSRIQLALKAPKDQKNQAGKFSFSYRKASDILQAVKPLLEKDSLSILLDDEILEIGGKFYLKATVRLMADNGDLIASTAAYAETQVHSGMSTEQATGAASSYARKYALCGLLAIDDSKDDPDTIKPLPQRIEAITTLKDANDLLSEVSQSDDNVKRQLHNRATELGFIFNKESKQYEVPIK